MVRTSVSGYLCIVSDVRIDMETCLETLLAYSMLTQSVTKFGCAVTFTRLYLLSANASKGLGCTLKIKIGITFCWLLKGIVLMVT